MAMTCGLLNSISCSPVINHAVAWIHYPLTDRHEPGTVIFLNSTEPRIRFGIDSELGRKTSLIPKQFLIL